MILELTAVVVDEQIRHHHQQEDVISSAGGGEISANYRRTAVYVKHVENNTTSRLPTPRPLHTEKRRGESVEHRDRRRTKQTAWTNGWLVARTSTTVREHSGNRKKSGLVHIWYDTHTASAPDVPVHELQYISYIIRRWNVLGSFCGMQAHTKQQAQHTAVSVCSSVVVWEYLRHNKIPVHPTSGDVIELRAAAVV